MEIVIAVFLGAWLSLASFVAYRHLKKELSPFLHDDEEGGK